MDKLRAFVSLVLLIASLSFVTWIYGTGRGDVIDHSKMMCECEYCVKGIPFPSTIHPFKLMGEKGGLRWIVLFTIVINIMVIIFWGWPLFCEGISSDYGIPMGVIMMVVSFLALCGIYCWVVSFP